MVQHHFVLVHGACHGAWCWYKVVTLLKLSGHLVTALDLGGAGTDPRGLRDVLTLDNYFRPLMELMSSLPSGEKVVLVGHSFGGFGVSLAMEKFPHKVLVGVFLCAYMPNCTSPFSIMLDETFKRTTLDQFLDTTFGFDEGPKHPPTSFIFGPPNKALSKLPSIGKLLQDLELAKLLVRANNIYTEDLAKEGRLTEQNFGSLERVFVICKEDNMMQEDFQKWIIEKSPPKEVKYIEGADHMGMLSKPEKLCLCLQDIAHQYSPK